MALLLAFSLAQAQVAEAPTDVSAAVSTAVSTVTSVETSGAASQRGAQVALFLEPLAGHPALRAARASLEAARGLLDAARGPVSLNVSGGVSTFDRDAVAFLPEIPGVLEFPDTRGRLSTDVTFRPLIFGDVADLVSQREGAFEDALLDYRATLTGLEAQALEAALGVGLAEESLELARRSAEFAENAAAATRRGLERGATTERALRDALATLQEAEDFKARAEAELSLARLTLTSLVGETYAAAGSAPDPADLADLPLVDGVPLEVRRAGLALGLAEVGSRSASRELYPTVQAGYTRNLDARSSLSLSLDSRTLQPSVGYDYDDPGRGLLQNTVRGSFQVGFSLDLSPGAYEAADAAQARVEAARAGLQAAQERAALLREELENASSQARRALALTELRFRNAQQTFEEARMREELGLSTSLETLEALVALLEADVALRSARQGVLTSTLDVYEFYALPVSEVLE